MTELRHCQWGTGRPLVLLPGWGQRADAFAPLAACLPGWRVLAPELPGHEGSAPAAPGLTGWTAALAAWLQRQELTEVVLGGWSLGGMLALALLPLLTLPVRGLWLLGTSPRFVAAAQWPGQPAGQLKVLSRLLAREPVAAQARFQSLLANGAAVVPPPAAVDSESLRQGLEILADADLRPVLPGIELPTLVLHGERDAVIPPAAGRWLAAALPHGTFVPLAGVAHALACEAPRDCARHLQEWWHERG